MKHRISSFFKAFKSPKVYIPAIIVVVLLGYWKYSSNSTNGTNSLVVQASTFVQEVSVTGKVVAAKDVSMGFEQSGRVSRVNVEVGDKVSEGQTLASLANGDAYANVLQRQAGLDAENAKLAQVQRGSRVEDITLAQADVAGSQSTLDQAKQSLIDSIRDAYSKSDDAVRTRVDQLFTNPRSVDPRVIPFDNHTLELSVNDQRLRVGEMLTKWQKSTSFITPTNFSDDNIAEARTDLDMMRNFLNDISSGVSSLQATVALSQTTIDKYKGDISTARTNTGAAVTSLSSAEQSYRSANTAFIKANETLTLKKNGSTQEDIDAQAAQVKSAEAQLQNAQAEYAKTLIRAPFTGLITKVDIKEGEISSPNTPVISMITSGAYEMESYISETDIAKVKVGQTAKVTLDSYGKDVVFDAKVVEVDPAETTQNGVSTYKTKLEFDKNDDRIRSGMTANITIQTAERPASIVVPQEAVFLEAGEKVVTVESAGKQVNKKVVTGGINAQGDIEIVSGLAVGDKVIIKK